MASIRSSEVTGCCRFSRSAACLAVTADVRLGQSSHSPMHRSNPAARAHNAPKPALHARIVIRIVMRWRRVISRVRCLQIHAHTCATMRSSGGYRCCCCGAASGNWQSRAGTGRSIGRVSFCKLSGVEVCTLFGVILRVGGMRLRVDQRDKRCVMVNIDPSSSNSDPRVLRAVASERDARFGVYGTVVEPGKIAVGDSVFREISL